MSRSELRVLLCDDSSIVRRIVRTVIEGEPGMSVIAEAADGCEGVRLAKTHSPDVIIMDVEMPICDGIEAIDRLKRESITTPVVMFSSLTERGAEATIDALTAGASDFATKPALVGSPTAAIAHVREQLVPKIKIWGRHRQAMSLNVTAAPSTPGSFGFAAPEPAAQSPAEPTEVAVPAMKSAPSTSTRQAAITPNTRFECITVGVSTGGPEALKRFVSALPARLTVPIAIVQHMPATFTTRLAEQLDRMGPIRVVEAEQGMKMEANSVYIAPGGRHLEIAGNLLESHFELHDGPLVQSCRPSVDVLFQSAAKKFGNRNLSIVLTGMGQDGLDGARAVREAGGHVVVQDEASSVVWGMPGVVWNAGLASEQLPPDQLAQWVGRHTSTTASARV